MPGTGFKAQIAQKLVGRIELVTKANGYSQDVKTVAFDRVKLNIGEYEDWQLPAVQVIDVSTVYEHQMSRSQTTWFFAIEICLRTTEVIGTVDQQKLWDLEENVKRAIMGNPKLDLNYVLHCRLLDAVTDLHLQEPNYISTIGVEVLYFEPITRENC